MRSIESRVMFPKTFYLNTINENEIIEHINSLQTRFRTNNLDFLTACIKGNRLHLIKLLTLIYNRIFQTGIIPQLYKDSIVGERDDIKK